MTSKDNEKKEQGLHSFNPNEHLMQIKSRNGSADYLPVAWRLVWFNEQCPKGSITILEKIIDPEREVAREVMQWNNDTRRSEKVIKRTKGWAYFHVRAEDGNGKVGEAVKSESAADFDDYIEKADTGATGRALAKIGYGTQFTGDEFNEQHRIVDAPVDREAQATTTADTGQSPGAKVAVVSVKPTGASQGTAQQTVAEGLQDAPATQQQITSLGKLYQHLGRPEPDTKEMKYEQAKELIAQLSHEYNEQRLAKKEEKKASESPPAPILTPAQQELVRLRELFEQGLLALGPYERKAMIAWGRIPENWGVIDVPEKQVSDWIVALDEWQADGPQEQWRQTGIPKERLDEILKFAGNDRLHKEPLSIFKRQILERHGISDKSASQFTNYEADLVLAQCYQATLQNGVVVSPDYPHPRELKKAS